MKNSRLASLKEKLVTRNSFYDDHTMMPVYGQEESKKKGKKKDDQTKVSSESAGKDIGTEKKQINCCQSEESWIPHSPNIVKQRQKLLYLQKRRRRKSHVASDS